jgi:hypothetical protein
MLIFMFFSMLKETLKGRGRLNNPADKTINFAENHVNFDATT